MRKRQPGGRKPLNGESVLYRNKKAFPEHSIEKGRQLIHEFWRSGGPIFCKEIDWSEAPLAKAHFKPKHARSIDPDDEDRKFVIANRNLVDGGTRERRKRKSK